MNEGQNKFLSFITDRVQEGKLDEAKKLLGDAFQQQQAGQFDASKLASMTPQLLSLIKPESLDEVKEVCANFAQSDQMKGAVSNLMKGFGK